MSFEIKNRGWSRLSIFLISVMSLGVCSCGFSGSRSGVVVGLSGRYNYSPSVIQVGNIQQFWWCGEAVNTEVPARETDAIIYESINTVTHATLGPTVALAESQGAWDAQYTCNPKVVRGTFVNPLGDGQTYTYAMYYVGTSSLAGVDNSIGVAFSNDGVRWNKYPQPVIKSNTQIGYGVGQPAVYNSDQKSGIWMFYEENLTQRIEAISTDGVHFAVRGDLTTNGMDPGDPGPSWGDMAYDPAAKVWYAAFNLPLRDTATTGGNPERGQYGIELYRIAAGSILTGATPWQLLKTVDTNLTGYECNFIAGLVRDQYGNVNVGAYPTIEMFTSISALLPTWNSTPADAGSSCTPSTWSIGAASWTPGEPPVALNRYVNGNKTHEVTTGWIDPNAGFRLESVVGHLYESPQKGATRPFYGCKTGSVDYFVSTDSACEGARVLGLNGYGYTRPVSGLSLVPLYRCTAGSDHFVSKDPQCEGTQTDKLLGYALP